MPILFRALMIVWLLADSIGWSADPLGSHFIVDPLGLSDANPLPQSSVIALTQTRDGYLWLGTVNGLVRYDGKRFEVFDEFNTPGLGGSTITHLFEDSHRGLWVGTETAGVVLIKDGQVTPVEFGRGGREKCLVAAAEDASGAVWLYTADGKLGRCFNGKIDSWQVGAPQSMCRVVAVESAQTMWVGTDFDLLYQNPSSRTVANDLLLRPVTLSGRLAFLLPCKQGGYWRLSNGRIEKCRGLQVEKDFGPFPWTNSVVRTAVEDREGNLIVGTLGDGVYWFNAEGQSERIAAKEGLSHNTVMSLCVDREGSLWVGTDGGGVNRVRRSNFGVHPASLGKTVQSVSQDAAGGLWIGLNGDSVNNKAILLWRDGEVQPFGPAQGLQNPAVRAVLVDRANEVWVGTYGGGLLKLEGAQFQPVSLGARSHPEVNVILEGRSNRLWVGTQTGLVQRDGMDWRSFTTKEGLSANSVRALAEDADGNLWIGTDRGGLSCLRAGQFTTIRQSESGLPSDSISALLAEADGTLWVGTPGRGLACFQHGQWKHFTKSDGLVGNSISYLLDDGEGFLWIGSSSGLMRVEKQRLKSFGPGSGESIAGRIYGSADGLPTRECSRGSQPAAYKTKAGELLFATTRGLVEVWPDKLLPNTNPPPVLIESVLVDDVLQNTNLLQLNWAQDRDIVIPAGRERLEIHFTSLNLAAPERGARFRYRLAPHETKWTEVRDVREARYPKLPHGSYQFQVTAFNEDGVASSKPAVIGIIVEPPFWQTWWFQTAAAAVLLGAIVGTVYFISTQKLQRQVVEMRQHEALEKERARIARDLHDQLGANLTQVALLGEMAEEDKNVPAEIESHARQICQTARDTSRALDEIVWAANPQNDTLEGLINYACKYAQDYLALADLRYRLDVPATLPDVILPPDLRHNVFLAFKESVNNVVKHAQASEVKIRLRLAPNRFTLEIEDDGCGPGKAATKTGRNGLRNMRQRMEDVGGTFEMEPGPDRGTIIRLASPIKKA